MPTTHINIFPLVLSVALLLGTSWLSLASGTRVKTKSSIPEWIDETGQNGCGRALGFACAMQLKTCFSPCQDRLQNSQGCETCLGEALVPCCPCLKSLFGPDFDLC